MGDPSIEITEESLYASQRYRDQAMQAISEGNLEAAIGFLTSAILCNPTSALLYATRASVYIKMNKPNSAKRDSNAALEINPDLAKGYKTRGFANAMLGLWCQAKKDLLRGFNGDFIDQELIDMLQQVEPNAREWEAIRNIYDRWRQEGNDREGSNGSHSERNDNFGGRPSGSYGSHSSRNDNFGGMPGERTGFRSTGDLHLGSSSRGPGGSYLGPSRGIPSGFPSVNYGRAVQSLGRTMGI